VTPRKINKKRPTKRQPQGHITHLFALLLGVALLFLSAGLVFRMVQTQKQLELVQSQLHKVTGEAVQAKTSDLESQEAVFDLKQELDKARQSSHRVEADAAAFSTQVASLKSELDRIYANRDVLQGELKLARSDATQVRHQTEQSGISSCRDAIAAEGCAERFRSLRASGSASKDKSYRP
jgi:uncharacterized protein (DUF3084 family)